MSSPSRSAAELLHSYARLASLTIVATFALVIVGGVVRVSDSGLGCGPAGSGLEGWPLCGGRVVPFIETNMVIEYAHRILAAVVSVLILALVLLAWRHLRARPFLVRGSIAAGVLVLAQATLGGLTVENNLHEVLVASHLGLAMLLLGLLISLRWAARDDAPEPTEEARGLRPLALLAAGLVLATIVAGGYMAGTEEQGTAEDAARESVAVVHPGGAHDHGAHMACGQEFPTCNGAFLPFGSSQNTDIHLAHRAAMYLAVLALLALFLTARRRGIRGPLMNSLPAVLAVQVLLGALNVWLDESALLVVLHLATGTLLWVVAATVVLGLLRVPTATPTQLRAEPSATPA